MLVSPVQGAEAAYAIQKVTADPVKAESSSPPQAFYFSPALVIDPKSSTAVLEYRNSTTGKVTNQYPSEKDIAAYTTTQKQAGTDAVTLPIQAAVTATPQKDVSSSAPAQAKPAAPVAALAVEV